MGSIYDNTRDFQGGSVVDFQRAATQMDAAFGYYDLDLSIARTNVILDISGDFLFADLSTNGIATIELNNQMDAPEAPIMFAAGLAIDNVPFKQLKISNTAQPNCKMRLLYSTGRSIVPSASMANINQILQPVNINDVISPQCQFLNYGSSVNVVQWTPFTIIDPSTNKNGMILRSLSLYATPGSGSTSGASHMMFAGPNAPAVNDVGSANSRYKIAQVDSTSTTTVTKTIDIMTRKLPAGWGVYSQVHTDVAVYTAFGCGISYELL